MTGGHRKHGTWWQRAVGAFVVVLIAAAYLPTAWHQDHAADKNCTVCKLGQQKLAAGPAALSIRPAVVSEGAALVDQDAALSRVVPLPSLGRAPPA
jgi:hypothetical protein